MPELPERPAGIPGSSLTGPWPVGQYAAALREQLRGFTRVQVFGEVFSFKAGRAKVWFELRDGSGALPCSMWRDDFDALGLEPLADGVQVVAAGGCDYYPGSRTASPAFSFAVSRLRIAGEGDLLAQLEQLRRALHAEGLFEPPEAAAAARRSRARSAWSAASTARRATTCWPRCERRGWGGRVVWAFAPVQDRHAAPAITRALQDLAACAEVEAIVVARGGGSLADLFAFCDETLCRTVALLRVPVISSVGHHTDRTLLDDVAAVACSTPTHAAEAAVPVDCAARPPRAGRGRRAAGAPEPARDRRARPHARPALARAGRARRAPPHAPAPAPARAARQRAPRGRGRRAPALRARRRRSPARRRPPSSPARAASCARARTAPRWSGRRPRRSRAAGATSTASRVALAAHDPQRTLERGYALVEDAAGEPVTSAAAARERSRRSPCGCTTAACRCVRSRP